MRKSIIFFLGFVGLLIVFSCSEDEKIKTFPGNKVVTSPGLDKGYTMTPRSVKTTDSIPTGLVTTKSNRSTTSITISTGTISRGKGIPAPPWCLYGKAVLISPYPPPIYPAGGACLIYAYDWCNCDLGTSGFSVTLNVDNLYLFQDVLYFVRTMAVQASGIPPRDEYVGYGEIESFYFNKPYMIGIQVLNIRGIDCTVQSFFDDQGASAITAIGFCWGTSSGPTIAGPHSSCTIQGGDDWYFTSTPSGLTPSTLYYIRPYATNSQGTFYGQQTSFTTASCPKWGLTGGLITVSPTHIPRNTPTNINATVLNYSTGTSIVKATAVGYHVTTIPAPGNWNGTNPCWPNFSTNTTPPGSDWGAYWTQQMTITKAGCPTDAKTAKVLVDYP